MTPDELRAICDSLNPGGQTRLAGALGMHPTLLRKKLAGKVRIDRVEELAIEHVIRCKRCRRKRQVKVEPN